MDRPRPMTGFNLNFKDFVPRQTMIGLDHARVWARSVVVGQHVLVETTACLDLSPETPDSGRRIFRCWSIICVIYGTNPVILRQ